MSVSSKFETSAKNAQLKHLQKQTYAFDQSASFYANIFQLTCSMEYNVCDAFGLRIFIAHILAHNAIKWHLRCNSISHFKCELRTLECKCS